MITLSLETATRTGGAALLSDDQLIGSITFTTGTLYSQRLMPSIRWLLEKTETRVSDLSLIAVSVGPGSFTGLRIGVSVARGLALGCGAKLVGVRTLEALALRASADLPTSEMPICTILDARQGQVYAGLYQVRKASPSADPRVVVLQEDFAGPIEEIVRQIREPALFAGDAVSVHDARLRDMLGELYVPASGLCRLPHPEQVAWLGYTAWKQPHDHPLPDVEPHYVRRSYASA